MNKQTKSDEFQKLIEKMFERPEYMKNSRHAQNRNWPGVWPRYTMDQGVYDTYVRIFREGHYWLVRVRIGVELVNNARLSEAFDQFNENCYRVFHLYRIDPTNHFFEDSRGQEHKMYYLDLNQQSETDRLKPPLG